MIDPTTWPADEQPEEPTLEELAAEARAMDAQQQQIAIQASTLNPPRRFTLCDDDPPSGDEIVFARGLAAADGAVVWRGDSLMLTESAERALRFYSRIAPVRLVWLDPEPSAM